MKRLVIAMACLALIVYGCSKASSSSYNVYCTGPAAVTDSSTLLSFAATHGITPKADTSWLYYQIIDSGTGATPVATSKVYVRDTGMLMNGAIFDATPAGTTVRYELDSLIQGWQYGLPKIKSGGHIKLLIPSALAYGCAGASNIAPNTPVYFNVYLDSLK